MEGEQADGGLTTGAQGGLSVESLLRELRQRADEDFLAASGQHERGRHQLDLPGLGLRVSMTRNRYPDRPDGVDQYAITVTRLALDTPPEEAQSWRVLYAAFGEDHASLAVERPGSGLARMFRVPAR